MQLEAIEETRLTALMHVVRPSGQLFLPFAAAAIAERYSFQVVPDVKSLLGDVWEFGHGVYDDKAFDLAIYPDGAVLKSRSNSDFLELVLGDVLSWSKEELGLQPTSQEQQRFFDSELVVSMDPSPTFPTVAPIAKYLKDRQRSYGLKDFDFEPAGFSLAVDPTLSHGRRPGSFTFARRANLAFASNFYFSSAPLKTADHLRLLEQIEERYFRQG